MMCVNDKGFTTISQGKSHLFREIEINRVSIGCPPLFHCKLPASVYDTSAYSASQFLSEHALSWTDIEQVYLVLLSFITHNILC
jgi:hypothetical protein